MNKYVISAFIAISINLLQCAGTLYQSDVPAQSWGFAYLCVENNLNKLLIIYNQPVYSKFIAERIDSASGIALKEKDIEIGPAENAERKAVWDDTVSCSSNVYYRVFSINSKTGEKLEIRIAHAINVEKKR